MCLVIKKKYYKNTEQKEAYKVFYRSSKGLVSFYRFTPIVNNKLVADGEPHIVAGFVNKNGVTWKYSFPKNRELEPCLLLEGGCIHCFSNKENILEFFSYAHPEDIACYKVMGRGIVAEGTFEGIPSICFEEIELIEEIKLEPNNVFDCE